MDQSQFNISTTSELEQILQNQDVEVAYVDKSNQQCAKSIDRNVLLEKAKIQEKAGDVAAQIKGLSWEDRYQWVFIHKTQGNHYFKQKKYQQAQEIYMKGLMGCDLNKDDLPRYERVQKELQYPLTFNIGMCEYYQKNYSKTIKLLQMAENIDNSQFKLHYMKTKVYLDLNDLPKAELNLKVVQSKVNHDPINYKSYDSLRSIYVQKLKKDKKLYQTMFQKMELQNHKEKKTVAEKQKEYGSDDNGSVDEEVLEYDDEWYHLNQQYGIFKFLIYPFKKIYGAITLKTCRRRKQQYYSL